MLIVCYITSIQTKNPPPRWSESDPPFSTPRHVARDSYLHELDALFFSFLVSIQRPRETSVDSYFSFVTAKLNNFDFPLGGCLRYVLDGKVVGCLTPDFQLLRKIWYRVKRLHERRVLNRPKVAESGGAYVFCIPEQIGGGPGAC